jgi:hypothetical protein
MKPRCRRGVGPIGAEISLSGGRQGQVAVPTFQPVPTFCLGSRKTGVDRAIPLLLPSFIKSSKEVSRLERLEQRSDTKGLRCSNLGRTGWNICVQ